MSFWWSNCAMVAVQRVIWPTQLCTRWIVKFRCAWNLGWPLILNVAWWKTIGGLGFINWCEWAFFFPKSGRLKAQLSTKSGQCLGIRHQKDLHDLRLNWLNMHHRNHRPDFKFRMCLTGSKDRCGLKSKTPKSYHGSDIGQLCWIFRARNNLGWHTSSHLTIENIL